MTGTGPLACHVCDGEIGDLELADCLLCGRQFHLQMVEGAAGADCGDVWIDDEVLALQFACRPCIETHAGPGAAEADAAPAREAGPRRPIRPAAAGQSARDVARRRR